MFVPALLSVKSLWLCDDVGMFRHDQSNNLKKIDDFFVSFFLIFLPPKLMHDESQKQSLFISSPALADCCSHG